MCSDVEQLSCHVERNKPKPVESKWEQTLLAIKQPHIVRNLLCSIGDRGWTLEMKAPWANLAKWYRQCKKTPTYN